MVCTVYEVCAGRRFTAEGRRRRELVRLAAVERFEQRAPVADIAAELRVSERSVQRWRRAWQAGGAPGLASKGQAARCRLGAGQLAELDLVLDAGPAAAGWEDQRWTLARVRDLIAARFRVADLAPGKRTAAALGAWIVFEDETGQTMRPPRSRTWGRRGTTPVIRVRGGGSGSVSVAGLACYRPGHRTRLIYRLRHYRGRKGQTKAFTWTEYRDLLTAAHRQLPGGNMVLVWDNLTARLKTELRAFTGAQPWLQVFQLPSYAPELNPLEGIWSSLKRGPLANVAFTGFGHLLQAVKTGLRKIQYQPVLIEGYLAGTGLSLEPDEPTS